MDIGLPQKYGYDWRRWRVEDRGGRRYRYRDAPKILSWKFHKLGKWFGIN